MVRERPSLTKLYLSNGAFVHDFVILLCSKITGGHRRLPINPFPFLSRSYVFRFVAKDEQTT